MNGDKKNSWTGEREEEEEEREEIDQHYWSAERQHGGKRRCLIQEIGQRER